ncbi:hypothetical protein DEV91_10234 [Phyllobacterium brassicacearum]|nr:hypothetical protein DEV91_10234 [Phyllobacterium brassicacearum]
MGVGVMSGETVKRILRFPIAMVLPLAVMLSACQTPAVVRDVHMGADIIYGADVIAYFGLIEALHAQPVYSSKAGFGLKTSFQSPRRLRILEAWSYGKQFDYAKGIDEKMPCPIPPCMPMNVEQGVVSMMKLILSLQRQTVSNSNWLAEQARLSAKSRLGRSVRCSI